MKNAIHVWFMLLNMHRCTYSCIHLFPHSFIHILIKFVNTQLFFISIKYAFANALLSSSANWCLYQTECQFTWFFFFFLINTLLTRLNACSYDPQTEVFFFIYFFIPIIWCCILKKRPVFQQKLIQHNKTFNICWFTEIAFWLIGYEGSFS